MTRILTKLAKAALLLVFYGVSLAPASLAAQTQASSLGDVVVIKFADVSKLSDEKHKLTNATLFLDDFPMRGLHPIATSYASNSLSFYLSRNPANTNQWTYLYKSTGGLKNAELIPSVGFEDDLEHVSSGTNTFIFRKFGGAGWVVAGTFLVLAAFTLLLIYGAKSNLLRESTPFEEKDFKLKPIPMLKWLPGLGASRAGRARPPFSLGRVQMAIWFVVIFVSYIYLWVVLGERNSFNTTALTLLGITTATALISRAIDVSKQDSVTQLESEKTQLEARQKELEAMPAPLTAALATELTTVKARIAETAKKIEDSIIPADEHTSDGFFTDILSDENGISLQRLQMVGWTLVLSMVFIADVCNNYIMPDFDNTLLGLMGISSGAFLGFKVPEKNGVPKQ